MDSYPDADGKDHWYTTKFRKYPDAEAGWADLAVIMYKNRPTVLMAASAGDAYGVSANLYSTKYYTGRGKTAAERIAGHQKALLRNLIAQCKALKEPPPESVVMPAPVLKRGTISEDVKTIQRWAGLVADGVFGSITETWVKEFQSVHGLNPDGVVGDKTWKALSAVYEPTQQDIDDKNNNMIDHMKRCVMDFRQHTDEFVQAVNTFVDSSAGPK